MTLTHTSKFRLACVVSCAALLGACGLNGPDLSGVRAGSQAVHPSPSALAQATTPADCEYTTGGACIAQ